MFQCVFDPITDAIVGLGIGTVLGLIVFGPAPLLAAVEELKQIRLW